MRRMEASCAPTSYLGAHSRTGGFHAQAVAFSYRFTFEKLGQTPKTKGVPLKHREERPKMIANQDQLTINGSPTL